MSKVPAEGKRSAIIPAATPSSMNFSARHFLLFYFPSHGTSLRLGPAVWARIPEFSAGVDGMGGRG